MMFLNISDVQHLQTFLFLAREPDNQQHMAAFYEARTTSRAGGVAASDTAGTGWLNLLDLFPLTKTKVTVPTTNSASIQTN
ncbi:hypothetical protein V8E36_002414 [Tilletia maclaganii]